MITMDDPIAQSAQRAFMENIQQKIEKLIAEHSEFFCVLEKAKDNDPIAEKILMASIEEIEKFDAADRSELFRRVIHVRGKPGRVHGQTEIGKRYREAALDIIQRADAGKKMADLINEWAAKLNRPTVKLDSIKSQLRSYVHKEQKRILNNRD